MTSSTHKPLQHVDCWLFETVLPHWFKEGLDSETGLSVECLDMDGQALTDVPRRGRVIPRQLFAFARALRLGYDPAQDEVLAVLERGADTLATKSYCAERGFPSEVGPTGEGTAFDAMLYDYAFIALAGAELEALDLSNGQWLSETAFKLIDMQFRDHKNGGYHTQADRLGKKLANPHMHLLEASLLHHTVTGSEGSKHRICMITSLCVDYFILEESGLIAEQCEEDFQPSDKNWVEPGHCYEWAFLLNEASETLGDATLSDIAAKLFNRSEAFVEGDGLVMDRAGMQHPTYRLWPQLERLRCLATFGRGGEARDLLAALDQIYFAHGPQAAWVDKVDCDRQSMSDHVPTSMLYHLMTAIPTITRIDIVI